MGGHPPEIVLQSRGAARLRSYVGLLPKEEKTYPLDHLRVASVHLEGEKQEGV